MKQEEPFGCQRCAKPFGMKAQIERVKPKLTASTLDVRRPRAAGVLRLCEDCRITEATDGGIDPYAGAPRPMTKTSEDWLREAERAKRKDGGAKPAPHPARGRAAESAAPRTQR